jgi:alkanesulfonate monooxygenase SsuD/methylene tetrahydromethanopterin reductase-like flavin-dependent oxidoreductase (luciferase family)
MAQGRPDLTKIIDLAEQAETSGFDSVWVGDSILARPRLEALTTLAAVATGAQTVVLRFGSPAVWPTRAVCEGSPAASHIRTL